MKIPPKPSKQTIYIDLDDEITSIIDKIENAKEKVVALVLPKRFTALQSVVNMRLLKRSSESAGKSVVLITSDSALLPLAGAVGVHVAKNLQSKPEIPPNPSGKSELEPVERPDGTGKVDLTSSEVDEENEELPIKIDYDEPVGELADKHDEENHIIELEDDVAEPGAGRFSLKNLKMPKGSKIKIPNFDKFRISLGLGILGVVALIVFIYLAGSVLPKATINIQTLSTPVTATLTMTTSDQAKTVDVAKNIMPVSVKTSDQTSTQQVQATGQLNSGDKASGTMTFYNCSEKDTLEGTDRTIPAGTGVSAGGLTFITQTSVTVSPSHFAGSTCKNDVVSGSVKIIAIAGGSKYNQDPTTYTVANFASITGTGSKTTGGTDTIQTVVSQADLDAAKAKISAASTDTFSKTFLTQLGQQNFYVLSSSLKIGDPQTSSTPAVGQVSSTATVTIKITYTVLVLSKDDLKQAITAALASQVDKTKQKVEDSDLIAGATISFTNQTSPTAGTLTITEDTKAVPVLDETTVKNQVKGHKSGDIQKSIGGITGVKSVTVKYSPFWVSSVPQNINKIKVVITHVAGTTSGQ